MHIHPDAAYLIPTLILTPLDSRDIALWLADEDATPNPAPALALSRHPCSLVNSVR